MPEKCGFNLKELMNQRSLQKEDDGQQDEYINDMDIEMLNIYDLVPSKDNFYSMDDIEGLKMQIAMLGVLQPLLVEPQEDGKYEIKAGHRRQLACMSLVEDEHLEKYKYVPCVIKMDGSEEDEQEDKADEIINRLTIISANSFRDKSDWEKMEEAIQQEALIEELRKIIKMSGRTRTLLREYTNGKIKEAQMGRYKVIKKGLCPALMKEFKEERIGISVAYEAAKLTPELQEQAIEILRGNGVLTAEDLKNLTGTGEEEIMLEKEEATDRQQEEKMQNEQAQHNTLDGNMNPPEEPKENRDTYESGSKIEKTEEQKYSEEQDKIDRDTKRKLQEQEDEEKMKELPSDAEKENKFSRVAAATYKRILDKAQSYLIVKGKYKTGDKVTLLEFAAGAGTGRMIETTVTHMDDETTSTAIAEGYCVINITRENEAEGKND